MKKLLALALALAMLLGVAACKPAATEQPPATDGNTPDVATPIAEVPLEHVYTMTDLPYSAEGNSKIIVVNDVLYYDTITYDEAYNAVSEIHRAAQGATTAESIFKTADGETLAAFTADDDGNLWTATITMVPTSDLPQYTLTKYTADGELLLTADISDVVHPYGMSSFVTDSDGNLYFDGQTGLLAYDGATADLAFTLLDSVSDVNRGSDGRIAYISTQITEDPVLTSTYTLERTLKTLDFAAKTGVNPRAVDEDANTELATLISGALKRLINDTLWYFPEAADYKGVIGTNIEYEYFYDATASKVYILTIAPMADCYRLFVFDKNISGLPDTVSRSYNSDDRQWLLGKIPVPLSGTGTIRVDDSHIPDYNVTGQELNVEQILSAFYETMYSGNSYYDIYIQYHYKSSDVTYIMYSFDGTTWCSRIALSDMSVAKPFQLIPGSDADSYFIEKLQESSYKAL